MEPKTVGLWSRVHAPLRVEDLNAHHGNRHNLQELQVPRGFSLSPLHYGNQETGLPSPRPSAHDSWSSAQLSSPGCILTTGPRLLPHCRYWRHALLFSIPSTDQLHCADDKAMGLLITQGSASQVSPEGCKCRCKPRDSPQLELGLPTLSPSSRPGSSVGPPEGCLPCVTRLQVRAKL